jgi:aerobic-type carbon monoxide dehydrogenase small subunit (CoxS/CutS family)
MQNPTFHNPIFLLHQPQICGACTVVVDGTLKYVVVPTISRTISMMSAQAI